MQRRPFVQMAGLTALAGLIGSKQAKALARARGESEESWSFVLLPDTQCYSESYPEMFLAQTEWIARQRHTRNIKFVLHLGDITNNNVHPEWQAARRAMDEVKHAGIPHLLVPGNHDMGPWGNAANRESHFSDYFIQRNARVRGESENAFLKVTVGEAKLLVVGLEFAPRTEVVEWANEVVSANPDHHAILLTHAYMYHDSTRYDWATKGRDQSWNPNNYGVASDPAGVHDGEALWQKLVRKHPQFRFTFNGHVLGDGLGHLESRGDGGNTVHQMLVNYQCGVRPARIRGGGGFLRLMEVSADGSTVTARDYSPYLDEWLEEPDRNFTVELDNSLNSAPSLRSG